MMRLAHRLVRATAALALVLAALPARAEDEPGGPARREVGGHRFLVSNTLSDPFVTTHVATLTGFGLAGNFKSPFFDVDGDTLGSLEGDIAFFGLEFEYQQNLFRWASLRLRVSATGRAGIDEESLLADGVNTIYGTVLEGKARILRREKFLLTGLAKLSRKNIFGITPFDFAQDVVDGDTLTNDNSLVQEGNILRAAGGLAGVWAPKPWLGLGAQAHLGYAQPPDEAEASETVFPRRRDGEHRSASRRDGAHRVSPDLRLRLLPGGRLGRHRGNQPRRPRHLLHREGRLPGRPRVQPVVLPADGRG